MELEDQEGFNNTHNYHPKPYNSSSTKKYHGERSPVFNLNVPLSEKNMTQFLNSFEKTKSFEAQLGFLNALLKASPHLLEKFAETKGVTVLSRILHESIRDLAYKAEIIDRILTYFNKIEITKDILTRTRIHQEVESIKNSPGIPEELSNKTFKLLIKWKPVIEEWQAEDGERAAYEYFTNYQRERAARSFIKRTNGPGHDRYSNDSRSESRSSEENRSDYSRKPSRGDSRKLFRPRRDGGYSRQGQNKYYSRRSGGRKSPSEERPRKKSVMWYDESSLVKVKYFRFNDEPAHRALTEEEVTQIQEKLLSDKSAIGLMSSEDLKHKESQMEGNSFKIKKDNEKEIQSKLNAMVESIPWYKPKRILLTGEPIQYGVNSIEAKEHDKRTSTKLPCFYLKEYQIPDHPSFGYVKNNKNSTSTPVNVPLINSTAEGEAEAEGSQDIMEVLEKIVREGNPEAIGTAIPTEKKPEENKTEMALEKEQKKVYKSSQPVRGILKKSREQIQKEKEEAKALEEEKQKEREKEKKGISLDSDIVMKLMNGELTHEEQEKLVNDLKEKGDAEGLLQNIATLKKFMTNVSQTSKPKKKDKYDRPPSEHHFGQEPRKLVKFNPEAQPSYQQNPPHMQNIQNMPNMHKPGMVIEQDRSPGGFDHEYRQGPRDYRGDYDPTAVNFSDRHKTKKAPFRPSNYKTVPCVWFHSPRGCPYGETCNFIHDVNHAGRQTPNMHKYVRPLEQINKTGNEIEEDETVPNIPTQNPNYPPMNQNPNPRGNMNPNAGNYYGREDRGGMNVEPYMNPNPNNPQNTYGRMNQPPSNIPPNTYMPQNPKMNHMQYNRMGGHHQGGNQMGYQNPHTQSHQSQYRGGPHQHGGHHSHVNRLGPTHSGHPMMMPPEGYRNDMMYPTSNQRMPPNQHTMQMQMGYAPGMMPPKNLMPKTGYGMMDPNQGKE